MDDFYKNLLISLLTFAIGCIVSLVSPIESPKEILFFEIPYMIIYGLILFPIGMLKQPIHRFTAAFLLIGYLLFIYQLF